MNCSSWIIYYHFEVYNFHNCSFVQLAQWIFSTKLKLKAKTFCSSAFFFIPFRIFSPWHIRILKRFMIFIKKKKRKELWSIWIFHLSQISIRPNLHISFYLFPQGTKYRKLVWKLKSYKILFHHDSFSKRVTSSNLFFLEDQSEACSHVGLLGLWWLDWYDDELIFHVALFDLYMTLVGCGPVLLRNMDHN